MYKYLGEFSDDIERFNDTYGMPEHDGLDINRLEKFVDILKEEVDEWADIDDTVGLADWLGDIIVYCMSELVRHSIDPNVILGIIMDSNDSKLDGDGQPIYDDRGKLLKGPHFRPPEPMIAEYLNHYGIGEDGLDKRYPFRGYSPTARCKQKTKGDDTPGT